MWTAAEVAAWASIAAATQMAAEVAARASTEAAAWVAARTTASVTETAEMIGNRNAELHLQARDIHREIPEWPGK